MRFVDSLRASALTLFALANSPAALAQDAPGDPPHIILLPEVPFDRRRFLAKVKETGPLPVPLHLRNAPTGLMKALGYGKGYDYAHNHDAGASGQIHLPDTIAGQRFYEPTQHGFEIELTKRLEHLRKLRGDA